MISLTHVFLVPKGSDGIRMIYNGTSGGINDILWFLHFSLPAASNTLRAKYECKFRGDRDVGEMFLNFLL